MMRNILTVDEVTHDSTIACSYYYLSLLQYRGFLLKVGSMHKICDYQSFMSHNNYRGRERLHLNMF
jgi:hypothetical protein